MAYNLRSERPKIDYKALLEPKLPKLPGSRAATVKAEKLYPVEVVDRDGTRLRIHYVGYDDRYDEWREAEEVETIDTDCEESEAELYLPYDPHRELAYQIKAALDSRHRKDPDTRIDMPFDKLLFDGGLKQRGVHLRRSHGHDVYGLKQYSDLDYLLGKGWHMRALNERLDFCYANLRTVQYYIHERKALLEFTPSGEKKFVHGGTTLVFRFIRMDGVKRDWSDV